MQKRKSIGIIFILIFPSIVFSQQKIKIEKNTCCDKLGVMIGVIRHNDSLSYESLLKTHTLRVMFLNCNYNSKATVESYELETDNFKQFVKGNLIELNILKKFEKGGVFIIKKCQVICTNDANESKTLTLPDRKIVVIPSE